LNNVEALPLISNPFDSLMIMINLERKRKLERQVEKKHAKGRVILVGRGSHLKALEDCLAY
jgi:hypothetical protein